MSPSAFSPVARGPELACRVDVPDAFRPVAEYGLRMCLLPFRLQVKMVDACSEEVGLYYGTDPDAAPDGWVRVVPVDATQALFAGGDRFGGCAGVRRVVIDGDSVPVLFDAGSDGDLSFDPIAAIAYLLGGFHEARTVARDEHGRMPDALTLPVELGVADRPIVEYWRLVVASALLENGVDVVRRSFGEHTWAVCPTHDVDYTRKWRPGIFWREIVQRGVMGQANEPVGKRAGRVVNAVKGLFEAGDPYRDALIRMREETEARGGKGTYFFKAAARGSRDVQYDLDDPFVAEQLHALRVAGFEVGLHPSYHAWNHAAHLDAERLTLEATTGRRLASVRMHYLRWRHATTARLAARAEFVFDSTLGLSSQGGFRAGTCLPFPLFDPVSREELPLWEVPLTCMESALFNRQGHSTEGAIDATRPLLRAAERFGGVFVGLWHNTLWDEADCPGWGDHFLWTLDDARAHKAMLSSVSGVMSAWE
ncbi:MAG: polysaccharide deacetylase family protein [Rhodothermales bacterium]